MSPLPAYFRGSVQNSHTAPFQAMYHIDGRVLLSSTVVVLSCLITLQLKEYLSFQYPIDMA